MVKFDNTFENNPIKIGKNAVENDIIISEADDTDIWFHLAKFPSGHVIIKCSDEFPIDNIMIRYCADLVKQNTKYRNIPTVTVNYVKIKNIVKTDKIGCVIMKGKVRSVVV